ncbi:hypothetical protein FQK23_03940 [Corynebacterium aurimucosum]|uniref:Alpha/beta hydrolase n=1 Tax=Corynebacterium aurimucosum TaxID=169292 RepID=A0A558GJL5_9CORY|nr:hypothetical protein [Corynebacterium aurimucosum]QQU94456.1 hypothetical protein I6I66_06440 [Corynebacterium aurimucosum]TVU57069.1 hypothetical protein FQK23_03940 [Corynebacterium aurimucosum]UTA70417.1 hypothetical protein J3S22_06255 [Corynebacterium aurimucosum]
MADNGDFRRTRTLSRWKYTHFYERMEDFLDTPLNSGLNTISLNGRLLDFVIRDRGAKLLLVTFHGALSPRQKTVPYIQGEGIAKASGVNLLAFSDPSLELGAITCAWFLGDRELGVLTRRFRPIIQHVAEETGAEKVLFFGGSGGGYAAVNFASSYEGSAAIAMNPRLNLNAGPPSKLRPYLEVCHDARTVTPIRRVKREFFQPNLADNFRQETGPDLLILQNRNDARYLNRQTNPFIRELSSYPHGYVQLFDGAPGHSPASKEFLTPLIRRLATDCSAGSYRESGFQDFAEYCERVFNASNK